MKILLTGHKGFIGTNLVKKLGKHNGLTQYEEAYIENWVLDFSYDMNIIELALKRTTYKQNPTFEYINNIITDWHDRNLKTEEDVNNFLSENHIILTTILVTIFLELFAITYTGCFPFLRCFS